MSFCLITLALLTPAEPTMSQEAPRVASVRLMMPPGLDERHFAGYLSVRPGDALDPAQIRKSVELLYATGRFQDVIVETTAGEQGVEIVVRPIEAPLLLDTRLEGDRVLSAGAILKAARLRRGEALYKKRLDDAAQAAALALEAEGYLEARVTAKAQRRPGGADAVFEVFAGPRARVGQVSVEQGALDLGAKLPQTGAVFKRPEVQKATQKIKSALVKKGFWHAKVLAVETYHPQTARMDLALQVDQGLLTAVEFRGKELPRKLRGTLLTLLREGALAGDAVQEAKERIEEALRFEGYRDAFVSSREETRSGGVTLVYVTEAGPQALVASVSFQGFSAAGVSGQAHTRALDPLVDKVVDEDVARLLLFLQKEGYAEAQVESDVPDGGGTLPVTFRLRPGPRTFVKAFAIEAGKGGPSPLPKPRSKIGQPYRASDVALDRTALTRTYQNAGYLQADVQADTRFSEDKKDASITLKVTPGPLLDVDRIVIAGLEHTHPEVVTRELELRQGGPLGSEAVVDSQRRLSTLGIFDRVSIVEIDPESPLSRSLLVTTEEAPRTSFAYGVGYAEEDLLRGSFEITEKNLFGMDRSVTALVRASVKGNDRLQATFREPYLLGRKLDLFLTGFDETEYLVGYAYKRLGGQLQTAFRIGARSGLIVRFGYQKTDLFDVTIPIEEIDRQFQSSIFAGPSVSFIGDSRDDPIDPHRGAFVSTDLQLSSAVFGGDSFWKGFVQGSKYQQLVPRVVLAVSARLGLAWSLLSEGPLLLPLPDRFFAGGDNSFRGFPLDAVGPTEVASDGTVVPSGGNALILGSVEFRIDTGHNISLAAFSDLGNVFALVEDMSLGDLRYTAGLGLRYKTPVGPLRLDYGYKLNRRPGESPGHLHVTIGYAF